MKKVLFTIILFLLPSFVLGMRVDSIYQKYEILENGNVLVKKVVIANPENGYYMDDSISKSPLVFTLSSFDNDLAYAPTGFEVIRAGSTSKNLMSGYDLIDSFDEFYERVVELIQKGETGKFNVLMMENTFEINVFAPSNGFLRAYYFEYIVYDAVRVHNDVAEVFIRLHDSEFNYNVRKFEARIYTKSDIIGVFGRGPIGGDYNKNGNVATFKMRNIPALSGISARVVIDPSDVSLANIKTNFDEAYPQIVLVEKGYADQRNAELRAFNYFNMLVNFTLVLSIVSQIYYYFKFEEKLKEKNKVFPHKYLRDFPSLDGPEVVGHIMPGQFNGNYFSAALMNLVEKKYASYSEIDKNDVVLILNKVPYEKITEAERKLIEIFFYKIGTNLTVSMKQVEKYSKNNKEEFAKEYKLWEELSRKEAYQKKYLAKRKPSLSSFNGLVIIIMFIAALGFNYYNFISYGLVLGNILAYAMISYYITIHSRPTTDLGHETALKWSALKNYIDDFGNFETKELPQIELWGKYIVYATAFGLATKLERAMNIKIEEIPNRSLLTANLNHLRVTMIINQTLSNSVSRSIRTSRMGRKASSSGSGGGLSSGGGKGGFGGSGGGF